MRRFLSIALCAVLAFSLLPLDAQARKRKSLPKLDWGLDLSAAGIYNSNVIGVSAQDRNAFLNDPNSFPTPLESVDDLENELQIHPSLRWRAPLNLMVGADYRLKFVHRLRNSFTDYQTHSFTLSARPRVAGYRWSARARVFGIPSYYLRVYRDRDYSSYESARFANCDYSLTGRLRWWQSLWSEVGGGYGTYYYNEKFTEYDSEYWNATVGSGYDFATGWSLDGSYTRRISENVGKDQPGVFNAPPEDPSQIGDTEYGDSDFDEDDFAATIASHLGWITPLPVDASLSYRWRRRVYTTDRSLEQDPFHRGRLDKRGQLTASVKVKVIPSLAAEPYFTYDERRTESEAPQVPLVKNFVRREFGLVLTYTLK